MLTLFHLSSRECLVRDSKTVKSSAIVTENLGYTPKTSVK